MQDDEHLMQVMDLAPESLKRFVEQLSHHGACDILAWFESHEDSVTALFWYIDQQAAGQYDSATADDDRSRTDEGEVFCSAECAGEEEEDTGGTDDDYFCEHGHRDGCSKDQMTDEGEKK